MWWVRAGRRVGVWAAVPARTVRLGRSSAGRPDYQITSSSASSALYLLPAARHSSGRNHSSDPTTASRVGLKAKQGERAD